MMDFDEKSESSLNDMTGDYKSQSILLKDRKKLGK